MAKLYPPVLDSVVPACYSENGMVKITIPFSMNRSVSASQVGGFELKIKTIQTGSYLYTVKTANPGQYSIGEKESSVTFYINDIEGKLKVGQFYKVQLAYIEVDQSLQEEQYRLYSINAISLASYESTVLASGIIGYYSSAATIKYTTKPNIYINNFKTNTINNYTYEYIGYYEQIDGDVTEKVYSYQFDIYDQQKQLILTSNELVHNSSNDSNENTSIDKFSVMFDLAYNVPYYIQYTITTTNQLRLSSPLYKMVQRETIDPELYVNLIAHTNFEDGYIELEVTPKYTEIQHLSTGSFIISRACSDTNYSYWEELHRFKLFETNLKGTLFQDYTVVQGKKYQYSIQQYNDHGLFSKRLYSNTIIADFEDAFLFDGQRQLKIRYNPKVSKFTNTILESKQDTIGSQYPFIFRNGRVNYNEFSIAGLISYSMDNNHLFYPEITHDNAIFTIDYTTENVAQEREFKMQVLEWLNNGQPKLFKSPTEGNFIVRLMKINLTPEDKLGRLLHSFNCSACEIAKYTNENLQKLNILPIVDPDLYVLKVKTLNLNAYTPDEPILLNLPKDAKLTSLHFDNMNKGDIVNLTYSDQTQESIIIGPTKSYYADNVQMNIVTLNLTPRYHSIINLTDSEFTQNVGKYYIMDESGKFVVCTSYIPKIVYYIISNAPLQGLITYSYLEKQTNAFSKVKNVSFRNPVVRQFIGEHDILAEIQCLNGSTIKNPKSELTEFYYIKVEKRPIDRLIAESIDDETLEDGNEFYYGTNNENSENRSERFPLIELIHPIGLRPYEPDTYWIKDKEGRYIKDPSGRYEPGQTYYLKGRYKVTQYPVGLVIYQRGVYYTKEIDPMTGAETYVLCKDVWNKTTEYYEKHKNIKGRISYHKVDFLTYDENYIFEENKFYRKTGKVAIENPPRIVYTLAKKFNSQMYYDEQYYYLDDSYDEYVNAYVTINENYVYQPYQYYIHVTNDTLTPHKDEYKLSTALEFNINEIAMLETDEAEYEGDVLKYYKVKTILPHILHEVGIGWQDVTRPGYSGNTAHYFQSKKYKDFYNNKDYPLEEYAPYFTLNGERINVNDTMFFEVKNLKDIKSIYELKSGNGVIVELMYGSKDYEYNAEGEFSGVDAAIANLETHLNYLSLDPSDKDYVDITDMTEELYEYYYNETPYKEVTSAYQSAAANIVQIYDFV